jgi:hypothetical protein
LHTGGVSHRAELLRAFHIGPEDLDANRAGVLGARPQRQLAHRGRPVVPVAGAVLARRREPAARLIVAMEPDGWD